MHPTRGCSRFKGVTACFGKRFYLFGFFGRHDWPCVPSHDIGADGARTLMLLAFSLTPVACTSCVVPACSFACPTCCLFKPSRGPFAVRYQRTLTSINVVFELSHGAKPSRLGIYPTFARAPYRPNPTEQRACVTLRAENTVAAPRPLVPVLCPTQARRYFILSAGTIRTAYLVAQGQGTKKQKRWCMGTVSRVQIARRLTRRIAVAHPLIPSVLGPFQL